ncbi:MAG: HU family DNA-binding protein [Paludibacteraceae bacterium]|nr:HU family DNA-binding protein [Paludibacteraceae bacterium]
MTVTREDMIKKLSEKSGFYMKDVRSLLQCLDEIVFDELSKATLEDEVQIQMVTGIKCGVKIVKSRERVNPRTQEPIVVGETAKPFAKFSQDYRFKLQEAYDNKNG